MNNTTCLGNYCKYVFLNVMGMIGLSCYILADTFFVSKALGTNGLAALNLALPIYNLIHGTGLMIGMGFATKYTIHKSRGETENADRTFTNAWMVTMVAALFFILVALTGSGFLIRLFGADDTVYEMAHTYLLVIMLFSPMFLANNVMLCFVRNDGAPKLAMAAMVTGSLSNIVLDYVFMFPLHMGIFGAVFATGLAPVISLGILSIYILQKRQHFHLRKCAPVLRLQREACACGVPSFVTEVSSGVVMLVLNRIVLSIAGNVGVAAYGIIANVFLVVMSVFTGVAQGMQPLLSNYYGSGQNKKVKAVFRYAVITVLLVSGILYGGIFLGASGITTVFNSERNMRLQEIAQTGIRIYFAGMVFCGLNVILAAYYTSIEKARPAQIISVLRGFVVILPAAVVLSRAAGIMGTWFAFPVTELLVALVGVAGFCWNKERKNEV